VPGARPYGETQDYPGRDERDAHAGSRHPPSSGGPDWPGLLLHLAVRAAVTKGLRSRWVSANPL
jgi:hypothetical protein